MATLILSTAGAYFGGPIGGAIGSYVGGLIDSQLFGPEDSQVNVVGPRLKGIQLTESTEGSSVARLYGRQRLGGQVIWASRFEEQVVTTSQTSGGGGKGGGGPSTTQTTTSYKYFLSFAIAFCEGNPQTSIGRIWADGRLLELSNITYRFYPGSDSQSPDSLIQSVEGSGNVPAFRGITYLVFERLPLEEFGNRMPQITAEIIKPIVSTDPDKMENLLEAITMIPATGEFVYGTTPFVKDDGYGNAVAENVHRVRNVADFTLSLDDLENQLPSVTKVSLVVSWFGDDLRAGNCKIKPKVERADKTVFPNDWVVNGIARASADLVTVDANNRPVYGGTPSDDTIVQAIQEMRDERGLEVYFYPFVLMDIEGSNTLPNPYSNNAATAGQDAYPWRGRITVSPAAGFTGTVDKTATAATQISAFFGGAAASDFTVSGTTVSYTGASPTEFGYRRMILHYAKLCIAAGGVEGFFIGSELGKITTARSATGTFPSVTALVTLAADVSALFNAAGMSSTKVSYAANWDEYHSYRPTDGSNDVYFHLDPLWSSSDIDFIGIDNYAPMSDWRNGVTHLDYDAVNGPTKVYDKTYLADNIEGGEYYDWYYVTPSDRESQTRTTITDGTYSKPWVFRDKDFRNWWLNTHKNRPLGVESGSTTSWVAESKPIYFSEFGCPAIDKGTNQPNVFYDPKSSESAYPYYSSGLKDDLIQRNYIEVMVSYWRDNAPTSTVYGDKMILPENMFVWTWDARPYPAYPSRTDVWSDGANYRTGHWLNGRVGQSTLAELIQELCTYVGFGPSDIDTTGLTGNNSVIKGYVIDNIMSPRDMISPLTTAYLFDGFESEGKIKFTQRLDTLFEDVDSDDFISDDDNIGGYSITRTQETELPRAAKVSFLDEDNAYQKASVPGLKLVGGSKDTAEINLPVVLDQSYARALADVILQESWAARERLEIDLPPSMVRYDPGDGIRVTIGSRTLYVRFNRVTRGPHIKAELSTCEPSIYDVLDFSGRGSTTQDIPVFGRAKVYFLDIPLVTGQEDRPWAPRLAGYMNPFPSAINVNRVLSGGTTEVLSQILKPSVTGRTFNDVYSGPAGKYDRGNTIVVDLNNVNDTLTSVTQDEMLSGLNVAAIQNADGGWEIFQYKDVVLLSPGRYSLSWLLRGQLGSETEMRNFVATGAPVVFLNSELLYVLNLPNDQKSLTFEYKYGAAELDIGDPLYVTETKTFQSIGLMPYAPTRLRARRDGTGGDIMIMWQRRTRFGGDDLDLDEVPLNEEVEKYDLEIYNGVTLVRSVLGLTTKSYLYTSAMQVTDFGTNQTSVKIRVYQLSTSVGRGRMAEQIVYTGIVDG